MKKKLLLLALGLGVLIIPLVVVLFISGEDAQARGLAWLQGIAATPTPSATRTPQPTPTQTPSVTATVLPSVTPFQPATFTPIPTFTPTATITPSPTPTPTLPDSATIEGISGRWAAYSLSCESRSAADWAGHFGIAIDEVVFFNALPSSDNPDRGFVGNVHGYWGQVPPNDYGVHAKPVAKLLREYGAPAKAIRGMRWRDLRAEIASGEPVIVWVIGHVNLGTPVPYVASDGHATTVARFEHTVIVFGYSKHKVSILDGDWVYTRTKGEFLDSWSVLGNQAVIWDE